LFAEFGGEVITNAWYVAGFSADFIRGRLREEMIAGKPLVLWRTRLGEVVAFDARCRHKRFPLAEGRLLDDDVLECAYHGFCYDATGACVAAPARGREGPPVNARLRKFPVTEQNGLVWIWPGNPERAPWTGIPDAPELGGTQWESVRSAPVRLSAHWRLLIENLLDLTHFRSLHAKSAGEPAVRIPVRVERRAIAGNDTVRANSRLLRSRLPPLLRDWFGYDIADRQHTQHFLGPGLTQVRLRVAPPGGLGGPADQGYVVHHLHTPVDRSRSRWWWAISTERRLRHPQDPAKPLADKIAERFATIVAEDQWALEAQQPMLNHPDDGYEEVHVKTDGAIVLLRKIFEDLERREDDPDADEIARLRTGRVAVGLTTPDRA
jgi:vanillate O-demethylase monooxygenase subunit